MNEIRALGIDPSLTSTGIVLLVGEDVVDVKVIKTDAKMSMGYRLNLIYGGVTSYLGCEEIHVAAIENPSHARNARVANSLGAAWGASFMGCNFLGLDPHEVKPSEHRKSWRSQKKDEACALVVARWPVLADYPNDAADAASVALWASQRLQEAINSKEEA